MSLAEHREVRNPKPEDSSVLSNKPWGRRAEMFSLLDYTPSSFSKALPPDSDILLPALIKTMVGNRHF